MVTITWQDGASTPQTFTISDAVLDSLEKFRKCSAMDRALNPPASVLQMLLTQAFHLLIKPALERFPTPEIVELKARRDAADEALSNAHLAVIAQNLPTP